MQVPKRKPGKYTDQDFDRHVTAAKLQEFKDKLKKLQQRVPALASEVSRLAQMGDFSENAEYQNAKGRLRGINQRILELEQSINQAVVIEPSNSGVVEIGSSVTVLMGSVKRTFKLLGSSETDPQQGIISHTSPIGSSLIGKKPGDTFTITLGGKEVMCVVKIVA